MTQVQKKNKIEKKNIDRTHTHTRNSTSFSALRFPLLSILGSDKRGKRRPGCMCVSVCARVFKMQHQPVVIYCSSDQQQGRSNDPAAAAAACALK